MLGLIESRREGVVVIAAALSFMLCGWAAFEYAARTGAWFPALFFLVALPAILLFDWFRLRAKGGEIKETADRLFVPLVMIAGWLTWMFLDLKAACP